MRGLIRVDGNARIGYGHAVRCLALGAALRDLGVDVTYLSRDAFGGLPFWDGSQAQQVIPRDVSPAAEPAWVAAVIERSGAALLITDSYDITEGYLQGLRLRTNCGVIAVIDNRRSDWMTPDLVLRQAVIPRPNGPRSDGDQVPEVSGGPYILVRREFSQCPRRVVRPVVHTVLVTLGGSEPPELARAVRAVAMVDAEQAVRLRIVVAGGGRQRLNIDSRERGHEIVGPQEISDMRSMIIEADLAVTACGTTLYEMAAAGLPAVGVALVDNQYRQAADFAACGTILYLGPLQGIDQVTITQAVTGLIRDQDRRARMAAAGQGLIDGHGARRCAAAILERVKAGVR